MSIPKPLLDTPPDPATGAPQLALDPLELIDRLAQQTPDPRAPPAA